MKRADQLLSVILLLLFLLALFESSKLPMTEGLAPGRGVFPFWLSLVMVVLSSLLLLDTFRRSRMKDRRIRWPSRAALLRIAAVFASLLVYAQLISVVGYILSTFAFLWLLLRLLGSYRWYWSAGFGLGTALAVYLVFQLWLGVQLPTGLLIIP